MAMSNKDSVPPVLGAALGLGHTPSVVPPPRRPTMLGVPEQGGSGPNPPNPPRRDPKKHTMLGVAPAGAGLELASLDEESALSERAYELDLEDSPDSGADLPTPASPKERGAVIDLPSITPSAPAARAPDSGELDLDISLPDLSSEAGRDIDLPDLGRPAPPPDLKVPRAPRRADNLPDLPTLSADLPDLNAGLPDLGAELPDLGAGLPQFGGVDLPLVGGPGLPDVDQRLPSLRAEQGGGAGRSPDSGRDPFIAHSEFPGMVDSAQTDPFARPVGVGQTRSQDPPSQGAPRAASQRGFGEEDEFDAFPTESGKPSGVAAGPAAGYGDVVLEGGGGDLDLGENLDRGHVPAGLPPGPVAAASAQVDLSAPARPEKYSDGKQKSKRRRKTTAMTKGTKIALFSILGIAVAGGALASLIPDVGPYGVYFALDQLKAGEYQRDLKLDVGSAQKRMALDSARELELAFEQVRGGLQSAPRFRPRSAYAAYIGYFHQLRFSAASDASAQAQALMDGLKDAKVEIEYLELAQLAQRAAQGHPEVVADQASRLIPRGIEYAVLVGEAALAKERVDVALAAWTKVLQSESGARGHFGMARVLYLSNKPEQIREHIALALKANPAHSGARILEARLRLVDRTQDAAIIEALSPLVEAKSTASRGEQVAALVLLGELHLERGRLKKAEESFQLALSRDAGSVAAQRGLARALFESGRFSEALARFESALSVEPGHLQTSLGVVQCKLRLEQLQDAVKLLDQLAPRFPNSTALAFWVGSAKEAAGDKDVAQASYEKAIKLGEAVPELVLAYVGLTRLLGQRGHHAEAAEVIAQAERRFPDDPAVFEALGELSVSRGSYEDAVGHFEKAIQLDPNNVGLHFSKGVALRQARRFDESALEFDLVEKDSKDYPGLALERGNLFEASGRSEQALRAYEHALAGAPDDLDLKLRVACGKAAAGQAEPAIEMLKQLLDARPNSAEVNFCQGLALLALGEDLPRARVFLERAVSRDPTRAKHHLYVGWVDLEMGDLSAASRALDETIKLDSTLADAYWKRGELLVKQRAVRDALIDLDKALQLAPSRTEAHAQKALAYLELGQEQEAMAEFRVAVNAPVVDPAWRYRFGDLLLANRRAAEASEQLQLALEGAKKKSVEPAWVPNAHRLLALALGRKREAIEHWQAYINAKKSSSDPYLAEAARELDAILRSLGH